MGKITRILAVLTTVSASVFASHSLAATASRVLTLPGDAAVEIIGEQDVADAGDVDGDGTADLLVFPGGRNRGVDRVYVVFGHALQEKEKITLSELGDDGFMIQGAKPGDFAANASGAGDVNGDGLDDVVIGASDSGGGKAYVVFGKTDSLPVYLLLFDANAQGPLGFRIDGDGGLFGRRTARAKDVNGDGLDDVLIAAPFRGASYVVFGKTDPLPIDVSLFHLRLHADAGFVIRTPSPNWDDFYWVGGVGDVNGDGLSDLGVSASTRRFPRYVGIVFGKRNGDAVDIEKLGRAGFTIMGANRVDSAGDFNGDGLDDIALVEGVVFGSKRPRDVDTGKLGRRGFTIKGESYAYVLSGGGDINGDGLDDFMFGSSSSHIRGQNSGSAWVIFGDSSRSSISLKQLRAGGLRVDGVRAGLFAGTSVAIAGDINGDGRSEIAIGSWQGSGRVYVFWGRK